MTHFHEEWKRTVEGTPFFEEWKKAGEANLRYATINSRSLFCQKRPNVKPKETYYYAMANLRYATIYSRSLLAMY